LNLRPFAPEGIRQDRRIATFFPCKSTRVAAELSIGKLGASRDQLGYYERQVAAGIEDYFAGRGESPGRWIGGGCGGIGLDGRADHDGFMHAMDGCDPRSGERLRPEHGRTRVAALDVTFSAAKSVSVLFAIGVKRVFAGFHKSSLTSVSPAARGDPDVRAALLPSGFPMDKEESRGFVARSPTPRPGARHGLPFCRRAGARRASVETDESPQKRNFRVPRLVSMASRTRGNGSTGTGDWCLLA
jgi:TrwC relaxase